MKKIGLFGYGCVGKGFAQILQSSNKIDAEIARICVKSNLNVQGSNAELLTTKAQDILDDSGIDIIVELTNDANFSQSLMKWCLAHEKPFITASKKMIAENIQSIHSNALKNGTPVQFEGAVAGSIPIVKSIKQYYKEQHIIEVRGILNGSCNYILTRMAQDTMTFEKALTKAQKLGFAESDPSLDVSGLDTAYKAIILAYTAFDSFLDLDDIEIRGIDSLTEEETEAVRSLNKKVKLIATIKRESKKVTCEVKPEILDRSDLLYGIDEENNGVEINTLFSGKHLLVGKGAGGLPTGSAVINDLKTILGEMQKVGERPVSFC